MGAGSPDHGEQINTPAGREPLQAEVSRPLVAIVDDEPDLLAMAETYLRRDGFQVVTAGDARTAAAVLRQRPVDLLVLDLMLPDGNGLDFLRGVRAGRHLPVIILTGRTTEQERVVGLELGADDYMVKPFSLPELAARIRAVLRRTYPQPAVRLLELGDLVVDLQAREVTVGPAAVELTPLEYGLLAQLAAAPRRVFTTGQLLAAVWGSDPSVQSPSSVTEHVYRLRRKLAATGGSVPQITTVRGSGYRLDP
ncbi:response regulator [Dactylosporangium siamense]|uniref:DNA-binding response regulator n=1 Tax=Dactylosporangium siamense TaxID=685454 RepID=A0A919PK43_9ACTN|nr:response regulator transcription factor [Dactylosporangium siamense]GIG43955.1 DNA-binding response regulator [Dactylosporangium siamense]